MTLREPATRGAANKLVIIGIGVGALFAFGIVDSTRANGWLRYAFFGAKAVATGQVKVGLPTTVISGPCDPKSGAACRDNLNRIANGKRKVLSGMHDAAANPSWDQVIRALNPGLANGSGPLTQAQIAEYTPKCPCGGTYTLGPSTSVPKCSISGNGTQTTDDDHIIHF